VNSHAAGKPGAIQRAGRCWSTPSKPAGRIAESAEIQGEHLVFLNSKGKLLVLILLDESWIETERA
jgi:hypothetical protein